MHAMHDRSLAGTDLNLLVVLRALLRERQVTRAAARVGLSQSATSHALSRLRELYGDPLLVRRGSALELTPRAEGLLPALERGLGELQSALAAEPVFEPKTARRTFTIGTADYAQAVMMGPLLRTLTAEAPHVDLATITFPQPETLIETGAIDLGLVVSGTEPRSLSSQHLFDDGFVCLVRRDHPRVGKRLSLERYLELRHVLVAPSGTPGSVIDTELARRGHARRVALRVSNFLLAPIVVCESDFINTMPERLARQVARTYPLRLLRAPVPVPKFGLSMLWHPRLDHDPAQRWLRSLFVRVSRSG